MKRIIYFILLVSSLMTMDLWTDSSPSASNLAFAEQVIPPYAKWGRLAMEETKKKYPNAQIIDYLHIGKSKGTTSSIEHFKLWLKQDTQEFGVYVDIEFENQTEKIKSISSRKSSR